MNKKAYFSSRKGYITLILSLLVICLLSLALGSASMSFSQFWQALLCKGEENTVILYSIRLPRILAAVLAGIGLSLSGVLLQSVTGNSLCSPSIIGVSSGSGFFVVLSLLLPMTTVALHIFLVPIFAFFGAVLTTACVMTLAQAVGGHKSSVVLTGVAINALLNALISLITLIDSDVLVSYNAFSIGGFGGVTYTSLIVPFVVIALCLSVSLALSRKIDLLCLGTQTARALGVNVKALTSVVVIVASASAASVVSFAGLLGFVGLIVPHIARRLCGNKTRLLLVCSSILGGIITVTADLFGRTIFSPSELPVGITMAFVGVPFFIFLLFKQKGEQN